MITAVIATYWKEREKNIPKIIKAFDEGSVKPDEILIFNNNPSVAVPMERADVIQSSHNFGHRAKFISALLYTSDYYFFLDDDMCPNKDTLKVFMKYANEDCCLTQFGRRINVHERFRARKLQKLTQVDYAEGVGGIFCSRKALINMFILEELLKNSKLDYKREADLVLSMANKPKVVPVDKDSELIDIGQQGVGMFREAGHDKKRHKVIMEIVKVRGGEAE